MWIIIITIEVISAIIVIEELMKWNELGIIHILESTHFIFPLD